MLRLGVHLVAAGHLANFDAAILGGIRRDQFVEGSFDREFVLAESGGKLLEGGGLVGSVNDGFERGF